MLIAVLDADVLFPMVLRDTLLRAAAAGCFRLHWSARILDEVVHNLTDDYGMDAAKAAALRALMEDAFPDANVEDWKSLNRKWATTRRIGMSPPRPRRSARGSS